MPAKYKIRIGVDKQPVENFAKVVALGADFLHRYDNGPQKNTSLADWIINAETNGLEYLVQGTAIDAQGTYSWAMANADAQLIAVGQDDEPDFNRYDKNKPPATQQWIYFPVDTDPAVGTPAPHAAVVGWTLPKILADRHTKWKGLAPAKSIYVNFAGSQLTNLWYTNGAWHKPYIAASEFQGTDLHVRNQGGMNWSLYFLGYSLDKVAMFGGAPWNAYVECSDQLLDNDTAGTKRGPTPFEQSTMFWSALAHGAKAITFFPQRIGMGFQYWAMPPDNEARAKLDISMVRKYDTLIATGTRTYVATPAPQLDPSKGPAVWPTAEKVVWTLGDESLEVLIDLNGLAAPVIAYTGPIAPPEPAPIPPSETLEGLIKRVTVLEQKMSGIGREATGAV